MGSDGLDRLCIPAKLHKEILEQMHDHQGHQGVNRVIDRTRQSFFVPGLKAVARRYVLACPQYQVAKPSRRGPLGELNPIEVVGQPHARQTLDFIVGLPETDSGYDSILTVTDAFTKWIRAIPGRMDWTAEDWALTYFEKVYPETGLPAIFVSDRDPKFTSTF
jgi:hypothetical protein